MFLHISMKNPCSLFLTTIWMFLWRWGNNIILSKNSSNFKTLYWFSNYCKNDEMAVIIYCKHPTSVVPYTVKTSISKCTVTYIHVNVHNFIPFGFFWVTTCIHTIHTISTSNSLTEIKRNTVLFTRDLYLFINTYTNKIHLLICFKSIYTSISCYLSIHFQKKVLLLHQHWFCTKTVQLWNMTNYRWYSEV